MGTKILVVTNTADTVEALNKFQLERKDSVEFFFTDTANEAVRLISENNVAIVIADLRLRTFVYSDFFTLLVENFPKVFRAALFSPGEKDSYIRFSKSFHRSLKLPLNDTELLKLITDLARLVKTNLDAAMIEKINGLGSIPVLPEVYIRLEREINRPTFSMNRIAEIIQADPLMVARILHVAHSSFFNIPTGVSNLLQALNFLGVNIVSTLVLYVKLFTLKDVSPQTQNMLKAIKAHSMSVAKYSKAIMERETKNKNLIEQAYISGLLHDVGKVALIQLSDKEKQLAYSQNFHTLASAEVEEKLFGVSHINIGSYILQLWNFQDEIVQAVASHHNSDFPEEGTLSLGEVLYSANLYCHEAENITTNISGSNRSGRFGQWDNLFQDDIRPALDLPI